MPTPPVESPLQPALPPSSPPGPSRRTFWCLADLFNLGFWRRGVPGHPNLRDLKDGLDRVAELGLSVAAGRGLSGVVEELEIRVYGGWWQLGSVDPLPTRNMLDQAIRHLRRIPRPRLHVSIAESPLASPRSRLMHTVRWDGLRAEGWRLAPSRVCRLASACSLDQFARSWLRSGACPETGCTTSLEQALEAKRQKTVDTLLAVDALQLALEPTTACVAILSDDDDMVPSLLAARATRGVEVVWLRRARRPSVYDSVVKNAGIHVQQW